MSVAVISSLAHEVPPPAQRRANDNGGDDDTGPPTVRSASYADVPCVRESQLPDALPDTLPQPSHAPRDSDDLPL